MPKLVQVCVRLAMIYLVVGALTGLLYWLDAFWGIAPAMRVFNPTYIHLIVVGWLTQLIFAVAWWMFPVLSKEHPRGDERLAVAVFVLLNAGLILRALAEPWRALQPSDANGAALMVSSLAQVAAAALFVAIMWPRIRDKGRC